MDFALLGLFVAWYVGNIGYNQWNGYAAVAAGDKTKFAMTISTLQLVVGVVLAAVLWVTKVRGLPKLKSADWVKLIPVGVCSAGAHSASVFSLAAGGVAFGQIVKAAEPVFAALVGVTVYNKPYSGAKWVSLLPIVGGVILASLKLKNKDAGFSAENIELDYSMGGLIGALVANMFAAFKGNESHKVVADAGFQERVGGVANQFAVTTIVATLASLPVMIYMEMGVFSEFTTRLLAASDTVAWSDKVSGYAFSFSNPLMSNLVLSGIAFYMYNEWATLSLKKVDAATQSVANTAKRVFVIAVGVLTEGKEFGILKKIGCAVCLLGVYINANIDNWLKPKSKTN